MYYRKLAALLLGAIVVIGLLDTSLAESPSEAAEIDGFEYGSTGELKAEWTIAGTGFSGPIDVQLNTDEAHEGKQSLEIVLPPTLDEPARLILERKTKKSLKDVKQVRFWMQMDQPVSCIEDSAIYCANEGWQHFFTLLHIHQVMESGGWQKFSINLSELTDPTSRASWDDMDRVNVSFWFKPNQPENRVLIDGFELSEAQERSMQLNKN